MSTRFEPGAPVPDGVPLSVPEIGGNEWAYLKECLDTNFVSSVGPFVERFERELATRVGAKRAVATTTGTAALHVALLVAGVQPEDEVLVSTLTFIAPANAIRYIGAWPVFVDADPVYWQMDPDRVRVFLEQQCHMAGGEFRNRATGRRLKAIVPVHILGHPVDMDPILEVAARFGLPVIEDATESLGSRYRGRAVGRLGDIACFSFNGNKIVTTGGGGMIVTDRTDWADRAKYLTTQAKDDPLEFVHGAIGYNYRLTNIQAALGCAQLERLDEFIARKRRIARRYTTALAGYPSLTPMRSAPWAESIEWLYTIRVTPFPDGRDSRSLMRHLERQSIQARPLWQPIHLSPAHQPAQPATCPVAESINKDALSLPSSSGLTEAQQDLTIEAILSWCGRRA